MKRVSQYTLKKNYVRFQCPSCHEWLNTDISDAGKPDHCPCCTSVFISPGAVELAQRIEHDRQKAHILEVERRARVSEIESRRAKARELREANLLAKQERESAQVVAVPLHEPPLTESQTVANQPPHSKTFVKKRWMLAIGALVLGYFTFGIFVVQPIGAIPSGATIVYFRLGLNLPFVSSADGMLVKAGSGVSLLGRGVALAAASSVIKDRRIINLPYSRTLYLWTTGGREFDR